MRTILLTILVAMAAWPGASADEPATEAELQELQAMLSNLEADAAVAGEKISVELRQTIETIREDAIYLRVKMKKHRESGGDGTGLTRAEVLELSGDIRAAASTLRRTAGSNRPERASLEAGEELTVRLQTTLSTRTSQPGDRFEAFVIDPAPAMGPIVVPAGAIVEGVVEISDRASGGTDRRARLVLVTERVRIDDETYDLMATVVDAGDLETGLGDEKTKVGLGAGIGSILGAVFGGKKGAVVGAVLGGAGVILATEGENVELPRGTALRLRLDEPLEVENKHSES